MTREQHTIITCDQCGKPMDEYHGFVLKTPWIKTPEWRDEYDLCSWDCVKALADKALGKDDAARVENHQP